MYQKRVKELYTVLELVYFDKQLFFKIFPSGVGDGGEVIVRNDNIVRGFLRCFTHHILQKKILFFLESNYCF